MTYRFASALLAAAQLQARLMAFADKYMNVLAEEYVGHDALAGFRMNPTPSSFAASGRRSVSPKRVSRC